MRRLIGLLVLISIVFSSLLLTRSTDVKQQLAPRSALAQAATATATPTATSTATATATGTPTAQATPLPVTSTIQRIVGTLSATVPVIANGTVGTDTLILHGNTRNVAWTLTNEDATNGIRCEYGTIQDGAAAIPPTTTVGFMILPGATFYETTTPKNRLECTAVAGTPAYSVKVYR